LGVNNNNNGIDLKDKHNILLRAENIKKRYATADKQQLEVLKGISLDIMAGETIAVIGPSGAGKSTLLHILGGLDTPDEGIVSYHNENIFSFSDEKRARFRNYEIGFIFQFHHLLPEFTALENVFLPGLIANRETGEIRKKGEELLSLVGLADRMEHFPSELSGGEQQRVAVARALLNNPRILFADEPSGNLDQTGGRLLHDLLWNLNKERGVTLFVVTHNMELAERADRIIRLIDGKIA
jgi:lipoprotein-releasing system ATP-binding protein